MLGCRSNVADGEWESVGLPDEQLVGQLVEVGRLVGRGPGDERSDDAGDHCGGGGEGPQLVVPVERIGELALGSDERYQHRDAQGAADLAGGLVDGAAHGEASRW